MKKALAAVLITAVMCGLSSAGQMLGPEARVAGIHGNPAGAAISSVLKALSPQMRAEVTSFLVSPGYDALRLDRAVSVIAAAPASLALQGLPIQAPNALQPTTSRNPADALISPLWNPQSEGEQALLAEKMRGLVMAVGPLLPEPTRLQLAQAAFLTQSRLSPEDRQRLGEKMTALAQALGRSAEIGGAGSAAPAAQGGGVDENSFARRSARLLPAERQPSSAKASPADKPESTPLEILSGTWRKVSGKGVGGLEVATTKAGVQLSDRHGWVYQFSGINGPAVADRAWHGSGIAPGGRVTAAETTRFNDAKLEWLRVRTERPMLGIPTQLVTRYSLALRDGLLVQETETTLYRKAFFYFGPYNTRTSINTTNLVDPERPKETTVYERATPTMIESNSLSRNRERAE